MVKDDILSLIVIKLLRVGSKEKLEKVLRSSSPHEIRDIFQQLDQLQKKTLSHLLFDKKIAAFTIRDFSEEVLEEIFTQFPKEVFSDLIQSLPTDDLASLFEKLSQSKKENLMIFCDEEKKQQLLRLLAYDRDSAGAIMNPNVFALSQMVTVTEAIRQLRKKTKGEMVFYLYVVDDEKRLAGVISLRALIMAQGMTLLKDLMDGTPIAVNAKMTQREVAQKISKFHFLAIPIVDDAQRLLGVITVDDIIEVVQDESMQELYRMAGIEKDERVFTPIRSSIQKRAPWLLVNLATAVLAAQVVSLFEGTIQKVVLLASFLPIVAGMGGNAGMQTLTVAIRGLALGEISTKDAWMVVKKEVLLGICNGILCGSIMAVVAYVWKGIPMLGLVIMVAMIGNIFVAASVGVLVPLGLKTLKIDPAVASTVVVTTFTDCCGFFFFLGLSALLIHFLI